MKYDKDLNVKSFLIFTIIVLFIVFLGMGLGMYERLTRPVVVKIDKDFGEDDLSQFLAISKRFADQHEYNKTGYNCVNYTDDLKSITDQLGFRTKAVIGCNRYNGSCHKFLRLEVDFEPQDAEIVDYSKRYPIQEVLEDGSS
jgi:hypothetical protein